MILNIEIDKEGGNASIQFKKDDDTNISWKDLTEDDQVISIYTLLKFTELFRKMYMETHPLEEPSEEKPEQS